MCSKCVRNLKKSEKILTNSYLCKTQVKKNFCLLFMTLKKRFNHAILLYGLLCPGGVLMFVCKDLLKGLDYECVAGQDTTEVTEVVTDSRKITKGCLFIPSLGFSTIFF